MWYSGRLQSMPMWLFDESALTLKVSSTHLRADGTKNLGSFNIEMPIRTAQCLWGVDLSKATRAVVSVLSSGSDAADVMTTASKVADGFYKISAAGFHFSTPTIKVKVEQVVAPASGTSSVKVPVKKQSDPTKLQTIKCFKGKEVKLFNRKSGKCPKGYSIKRTKSAQNQ